MPDFSIFIGNYLHKAKMDLHFIFLYFLNLILGVVSKDRTLFMSKRKSVKGPDAKIYDNLFWVHILSRCGKHMWLCGMKCGVVLWCSAVV